MKKILLVALVLILAGVSAEVIPLSHYSELEKTGNTQKLTVFGYPKYFDGENGLELVDTSIVPSNDKDWDFEVKKGVYKIRIKENGLLEFNHVNDVFTLKLLGLGFFDSTTKERILEKELTLSNPLVEGNKISWSLADDSTYSIVYENGYLKDVFEFSQQTKTYLKNNQPEWSSENILFGLIYDMDLSESNLIESKDFETTENIEFIKNGELMHSLRESFVRHQDFNSYLDANNEGRVWTKLKKFSNGKYIEVIPIKALNSVNGSLIFNATISIDVNKSSDDAEEQTAIPPVLNTTNTTITLGMLTDWAGIRFQGITIPKESTISDAHLILKGGHICGIGNARCENLIRGVSEEYSQTWDSNYMISDRNMTNASEDFTMTTTFVANGSYATFDKNVTEIVQEIIDRNDWSSGNPMSFTIEVVYTGFFKKITFNSFDSGIRLPHLTIEFEPPDETPPVTSSDINNFWQTTDANVHLTCTDVNGSGCNETYYRIDLDPTKDTNYGSWNTYDTNILISTDGNTGIQYYSIDDENNQENTKEEFILIDKTTHTLITENYLPNPSNTAKNYLKMQDGNLVVSYCYKTGYHLGDAYYKKSSDGTSWNSPTQINSDSGYCSGYYSENGTEPFRTGEGGISLTINSLKDLFFLFTEWNGTKAWTKILYSNETWSDATLIADEVGQSPNKDSLNVVADSNDSIHYIITQKSQ